MLNATILVGSFFAGYGVCAFLNDLLPEEIVISVEEIANNVSKTYNYCKEKFNQISDWWFAINRENNVGVSKLSINYFPEVTEQDHTITVIQPDEILELDFSVKEELAIACYQLLITFQSWMDVSVMFPQKDVLYTPYGKEIVGYEKNILQQLLFSSVPENTVTVEETPKFPQQPTDSELLQMSVRTIQRFIDSINKVQKGSIKLYRTKGVNKKGLIRKVNQFYAHC